MKWCRLPIDKSFFGRHAVLQHSNLLGHVGVEGIVEVGGSHAAACTLSTKLPAVIHSAPVAQVGCASYGIVGTEYVVGAFAVPNYAGVVNSGVGLERTGVEFIDVGLG